MKQEEPHMYIFLSFDKSFSQCLTETSKFKNCLHFHSFKNAHDGRTSPL